MTSSATPMAVRSRHSGPVQCGPVTAPRSPASPRMISSATVSTGGQYGRS